MNTYTSQQKALILAKLPDFNRMLVHFASLYNIGPNEIRHHNDDIEKRLRNFVQRYKETGMEVTTEITPPDDLFYEKAQTAYKEARAYDKTMQEANSGEYNKTECILHYMFLMYWHPTICELCDMIDDRLVELGEYDSSIFVCTYKDRWDDVIATYEERSGAEWNMNV